MAQGKHSVVRDRPVMDVPVSAIRPMGCVHLCVITTRSMILTMEEMQLLNRRLVFVLMVRLQVSRTTPRHIPEHGFVSEQMEEQMIAARPKNSGVEMG